MKKIISILLCLILIFNTYLSVPGDTKEEEDSKPQNLYAAHAVLMDAETGRVLFEKKGYEAVPMASTTKIMTLIIALEYGDLDMLTTVSKYAATMPDVQLNINSGEHYYLRDLLYSLMLNSHNDSAVVIAENVAYNYICRLLYSGDYTPVNYDINLDNYSLDFVNNNLDLYTLTNEQSLELVSVFAGLMNSKAKALGCNDTYFITPNGLDASDEYGTHSTSAVDLAKIMSYCIKNQKFLEITQTPNHSFTNKKITEDKQIINGSRSYTVNNANAFLNMMDGVISGKTGFTGNAGFCYVCALKSDDRTYICVLLACGWPPNKSYKWSDARKILTWGKSNFMKKTIFTPITNLKTIPVSHGLSDYVDTYIDGELTALLANSDNVNILYNVPKALDAPIYKDDIVGNCQIFINDALFAELPVQASESVERINFAYCFNVVLSKFFCNG